jgi:lysophospholipase L1-like esterase
VTYTGDVSACTFTWNITWGDNSKVTTVVQTDPPDGLVFLGGHTYGSALQMTYTITANGTVTGPCTLTPGTLSFTLLAYVALGDSFSSGDGADDYLSGTGFSGSECLRSANAYPEAVDSGLGNTEPNKKGSTTFVFSACTGAVIQDFTKPQVTLSKQTVPAQLDSLNGAASSVGLVTFTIGGNDALFGQVMQYCATRKAEQPSCQEHSEKAVNAALATIQPKLTTLYQQVKAKPSLATNAQVLVLGYPRFFPATPPASCATGDPFHTFQQPDMTWINSVIKEFDGKVAAAATAAGITYVDGYSAFAGHELCTDEPYFHKATFLHDHVESFHPTVAGQKAFAGLIQAALKKGADSAR